MESASVAALHLWYTPVYMFSEQMQAVWANRWSRRRALLLFLLAGLAAGCGQVITLTPTPTPMPTPTISLDVVGGTAAPTPTPAPYTPEPTPTPTVTPTPVIHTIQAGESLLAISSRYGVSVAALQEANGILDPRFLQIGQQLIIPRQEDVDEDTAATATPTPLPVAIENLHFSETSIGGLWVLGEVNNGTGTALEQVRVSISLLDESNNEIDQAQALVALDLVDPGERAPFAILFGAVPRPFDHYQVYPISAVPAYVGSYYRDLEVRDLTTESERYASYTVTGVIQNVGPEEAVNVQVVLTAYDPMGRVVATRKVDPEHNVIPRGGETTFTAMLTPLGGPVARVTAVAQGRRLQPTAP